MHGWMGSVLLIDLCDQRVETAPLEETTARRFLGGRGLGARLLWDMVGPEADALSAENALIFAAGPLTGSGFQTSGRFAVSTKSPLTGTILDCNAGGTWGMRLKRAGYDALIVHGQAASPVYLQIGPAGVTFHDAAHLWGRTVPETTAALEARGCSVLCIGPAGENHVRFAAIMNDRSRALGRGGPGAVMGAKGLKAIVVRGNKQIAVHDPERLKFVRYEATKMLRANPVTSQGLPEFGTAVLVNLLNTAGIFPARNFRQSQFEGAAAISGEAIADTLLSKSAACWACPIACTRVTRTQAAAGEGPEYESVWALGANCGIDDLPAITEANYLCNDLGLDTISAGGTIACAMEMGEHGALAGGPRFGQAECLSTLIGDIAYRRGLGDELAEGSWRLAGRYGVPELSMTVKGLELPAYDPRGMQGQGLLFATSNRGGCHMRGNMLGPEVLGLPKMIDRFQCQGKAGYVIRQQNAAATVDSLGLCKFVHIAVSEEYLARALTAVTGVEYTTGDLDRIGERIWNLERLYNLREGFTCADDTLPRRLLEEPIQDGPSQGYVVQLAPMLQEYYRVRGWDKEAAPTPETLARLGLDSLATSS